MRYPADASWGSFVCYGVWFDHFGPEEGVEALRQLRYGLARRAHLCDADILSLAVRDPSYRRILNESHQNFADGHSVAMVRRRQGHKGMPILAVALDSDWEPV